MPREAWARWGDADEAGALNMVGAREVLRAAGLVRHGRVVPLTQPLSRRTPVPPARAPFQHAMQRDGGDYAAGARRPGGFQYAEDSVAMSLHMGTHIDALCHVWSEDQLYNGHPGDGTGSAGAKRCGVETLLPIVTRGVLIDVAGAHGGPLADGYAIGLAELMAVADRAGVALAPGDAVLIRTGWLERGDAVRDFDREPGIDVAAAEWLAEAGVAVVGADNFAVEVLPFAAGTVFPVHQRLIRDYGIPLIEGLVLAELAGFGVAEFLFVAAALPIVGGTGSPLAPVAIF